MSLPVVDQYVLHIGSIVFQSGVSKLRELICKGSIHRSGAVVFSVSFDGDAIRDDYTAFLNKAHLEKVQNRAPRMAWREGTDLHLVNLSSLLVIEPNEIIEQWKKGIELAKAYKHSDPVDACLYGTLTSMFDVSIFIQ